MRNNRFWLTYVLMVVLQMIICNYFHFSQFVMLSILPVLILMLPVKVNPIMTMLIAFVTGFAVDFFAEGIIGLNSLSLVPVAFARNLVISYAIGDEVFARKDIISFKKYGLGKISFAILLLQTLFLIIYIIADGANTRPLWFLAARFGCSLLSGYLLSLIIASVLTSDNQKVWR